MSTIRYFDTAHIVRYGMINDDPFQSNMYFFRNGMYFLIEVDQPDVRGTHFEQKWTALLKEDSEAAPSGQLDRWKKLCDLSISQSLDLLQELAPNRPHWNTLYDYLHVDFYTLRLSGNPGQDARPKVVQGPTAACAYKMEPVTWETFTIPEHIPVFDSQVIIPLDHDQDLKSAPKKVRLPDGKAAFFLACKKSAVNADSSNGDLINNSHKSIASYLLLDSLQIPHDSSAHAGIPKILGVVSDKGHANTDTHGAGEKQMAGLLLEWIDGFHLLNAGLPANRHISIDSATNPAKWREQVVGLVRELHSRGLSTFGIKISPFTVMIDRKDGNAWLTGFGDCEALDKHATAIAHETESEAKEIQAVFNEWLKGEAEIWASDSPGVERYEVLSRWWAIKDRL